jgi:hypothetical protein
MTLRSGSIVTTYRAVQMESTGAPCDPQEARTIESEHSVNKHSKTGLQVGGIEGSREQVFEL